MIKATSPHPAQQALAELQKLQAEWQESQKSRMGDLTCGDMLLGVGEELGEFKHHLLKRKSGIKGTYKEHTDAMEDALGDSLIFLAGACTKAGIKMEELVVIEESAAGVQPVVKDVLAHMDILLGSMMTYRRKLLSRDVALYLCQLDTLSKSLYSRNVWDLALDIMKNIIIRRDFVTNPQAGIPAA